MDLQAIHAIQSRSIAAMHAHVSTSGFPFIVCVWAVLRCKFSAVSECKSICVHVVL